MKTNDLDESVTYLLQKNIQSPESLSPRGNPTENPEEFIDPELVSETLIPNDSAISSETLIPNESEISSESQIIRDIPYEPNTHAKHRLNIHIPSRKSSDELLPVVVHIHGGGWKRGDRSTYFYGGPFIGNAISTRGFICVVISYRVGSTFPQPIHDVANAVKWTLDNIQKYGGDPNKLFISGHSAGAHLATLLVSTPVYLDYAGIPHDAIKGVMALSGVYTVGHPFSDNPNDLQNVLYRQIYVNTIFGTNTEQWQIASPAYHLSQRDPISTKNHRIPPFCLFNATVDINLNFDGSKFHRLLQEKGIQSQYHTVLGTHGTITRTSAAVDISANFIKEILENKPKN